MLPANASKFTFELIGLADSLRVLKFTGEEAISTPYVFTIDIVSENFDLTADQFLEKAGVLTLVDDKLDNRLVHGEVIQFHTQGHGDRFANYRIVLVPKCQFMALKESTRIFQEKSIPTILKQVLGGSGISGYNVKFALSGTYPKRNYCVQYNETDLAFVERLMSEEGMFYFFEHHLDHHCMVISDRNATFGPIAGNKAIPFHAKTGMAQATDSIYSFIHRTKAQTRVKCSNCSNRLGKTPPDGICPECGTRPALWEGYTPQNVTLGDFNPSSTQVGLGHQLNPDGDLEHYRFPGYFETPDQAKKYTKIHLEADCADLITGEGQTQCVRLLPGKLLEIKQHFTTAFNRPYLLTKVIHEGIQPQSLEEGSSNRGTEYQSTFYTMPNETPFRVHVHPKPKAYDHQTALVCGPGGEEIYTDNYGRIKVQFHWDRQGQMDDKSSLWIRVAQGFAGNGYGSMVVPRIGQEVIVQFEYGNPDRPIVTGSTFNASNPVPEGLPFNKTRTVFRSNSSPDGDGHNELRIDDKKGKEQVYLHAEKDMDLRIKNDLKQHIQKDQHHIVTNQHSENIGKDKHLDVSGNSNLEVGDSLSIKVGKDLHVKSGNNHLQQAQQTHLKAATKLVVDGGISLTVKGGGGTLFLGPAGVSITGTMVRINSGGGGGGAQSASPAAPAQPTPPVNDKAGKVAKPGSAMIEGGNGWMVTDHRKGGIITMPSDATSNASAAQTGLASLASSPLIATPASTKTQEKDWLKIHLFWDDKHDTPAKGHPYKLLLADGSTREGELDDKGEAFEENLPTGTVQIEYISRDEELAKLTQLRNQLSTTLNNIVADAQRDADAQQIVADSTSAFEMGLVYVGAAMMGGWDMVNDFASFVSSVGSGLYKANMAYMDLVEDILTGDVREIQRKYEEAEKAGTAAYEVGGEVAEAINLLIGDEETWDMITDFPGNYWDALSGVDATRKAAPVVIELLITIITLGAGSPLLAANVTSKAGRLAKEAGDILADLLKGLKQLGQPLKKKATTNSIASNPMKRLPHKPKTLHKPTDSNMGRTDTGKACDKAKACTREGEPISMVTGEELLELEDFTFDGPLPLVWQRVYRSSNAQQRGLGVGWTHPASEQLKTSRYMVTYVDEEGRNIPFSRPAAGETNTNNTEKLSLTCIDQYVFVLRSTINPNQADRIFVGNKNKSNNVDYNQTLSLRALEDTHGNRLDFIYLENNSQLQGIQSSWGAALRFQWDQGLIRQIDRISVLDDNLENSSNNNSNNTAEDTNTTPHITPLVQYHYDENDDLIACVDANQHAEKYQYNNHIITQRTLKTGFNFYFEWDQHTPKARCTKQCGDDGIYNYRFKWDDDNRVSRAIDSRGGVKEFHYNDDGKIIKEVDAEGSITLFQHDKNGNITQRTEAANTDSQRTTHDYTYNNEGQVTSYQDPSGGGYQVNYNNNQPISVTDALGNRWTREYNDNGSIKSITDPNGQSTQYTYNTTGQPTAITDASGVTKHLTWDQQGRLTSESVNNNTTHYQYNAQNNITAVTHTQSKSQAKYDDASNTDNAKAPLNLVSQTTSYIYDPCGNIRSICYPDGSIHQLEYNANAQLTQYTDAAGRTTQYQYDGLAQVRKKIDPLGQVFEYQYDKERNLTGLVNEKGELYQLKYDKNERLTEEVGFDGRVQQYQYNAQGHLSAHIEGLHDNPDVLASNTTTFRRDPMGRLLEKHAPDGDINRFVYNKNGQLTQASNDNHDVHFEYTPTGQLSKESQNGQSIAHTYNPQGKRVSTTLSNQKTITYDYDENQQWNNVSFDGNNVSALERNAWGQETQRTQGALNTHTNYDIMGRLTQQRVTGQQSKQQIIQRQYQYNDAGNLSVIDDFRKGVTEYQYDSLDRLKTANGYAQEQFAFDPAGNLLDAAANDANSQVKGNRLQFQGDRKFEYDNAGNLVKENRGKGGKLETHYQYNKQNQLVCINNGKQSTQYSYDALGRRITKEDAFGTTLFLWNGDVLLSETRNHSEKLYLYEPESFRPLAQIQDGQVYHYHLDHLGTPQEMTNHKGGIVWSAQYKAYGNLALNDVDYIENNLRFQGQYFDEESGLHYNRHRYYDPNTARFTTVDPIGLLGGTNNYLYAPNPVSWIDPFGLVCKERFDRYKQYRAQGMSAADASKLSKTKADYYIGPNGPDATMPTTAYRYDRYLNDDGTPNEWGQKMIDNNEGQVTYFGYEKFESGLEAGEAFQVKQKRHVNPLDPEDGSWSDTRLRGEFDTLQLYDEGKPLARVPREFGDKKGASPEPFTTAYPEFGKGGAQQLHADRKNVKFDKVDILPEE